METASDLKLPVVWQNNIQKIIDSNKMLYECWVESASSYEEIRQRMRTRGYTNIPNTCTPMLEIPENPPKANTSSCKIIKTMLRKGK